MEPGTARIAVDLLGGDDAPAVVVDGALRAMRADPDLHLLLVGPTEAAGELIGALDPEQRARVAVRPVDASVGMGDHPVAARADSTVRAAVHAVREGSADALVSAGSTGATVTAVALGLGRWPDVRRPALVATLPAVDGPVVLLDVGGSLEPRPATLARHAALGVAYAAVTHGVAAPRVGLLSVGTEAGKGDRARRLADSALAATALPSGGRYVGLVEGYDVSLGTRADVVVTDGFTGNVLLKAIEGAYAMAGGPPASGGAPRAAALLGVAGTVVVCHGAARGDDLASGIALAAHLWRRRAADQVRALLNGADAGDRADHTDRTTDTEVRTS
ncbi:phosphate acyltransferase PlsX [Micromonospora thermarum]|uniref:Phosphate acyltransferase n=1 Tax=Micromonospora thermarum TaxID=2720024 RepID=A0ABX0Z3N6_9ACTN|nr:phosphate acyltransferase PlsX [Micromonospora thermarum]NJP30826.1 phosphate acyltransferase PlsX [Micromonospora thermarum]